MAVTYEEAKKIAREKVPANLPINWAGELPGAYIFKDKDHDYDGGLPIVIRKSDGRAINYMQYLIQADEYADNIKEIEY